MPVPAIRQGGRSRSRPRGTALDLLPSAAKFALPVTRDGSVRRSELVGRILAAPEQVVSIAAPAGYGKSTTLRQIADERSRVTYVRLDASDNDSTTLLVDLVAALGHVHRLDPSVMRRVAAPGNVDGVTRAQSVVVGALWRLRRETLLILDDAHLVVAPASTDALAWITERLPPTLRLVVAGRGVGFEWLARATGQGRVLELGREALALSGDEVHRLAENDGLELTPGDVAEIEERTEGWPVAVYLDVHARRRGTPSSSRRTPLRADTHAIEGYMRSQLLTPLDEATRRWLARTSVLDWMSGPLCDAALESTGSLARLRELERANALVLPNDERRRSYRLHNLLRDLLRDELEVQEPGLSSAIAGRASAWCAEQGLFANAIEYAHEAGDRDALARLVERYALPAHQHGALATADRWLGWFDREGVAEQYASIAIFAGWANAMYGRTSKALHWLSAAERSRDRKAMPDGTPSSGPWVASLRAAMAPAGVKACVADAQVAVAGINPIGPFAPMARVVELAASLMSDSLDRADEVAAEAVEVARAWEAGPGLSLTLGERASIAMRRGDHRSAADYVADGLAVAEERGLGEYPTSALLYGVAARIALESSSPDDARRHLAQMNRIRPYVTDALPWLAVQVRLEGIRTCVGLRDAAAARTLLREIGDILRRRPDLGLLAADVEAVRPVVASMRSSDPGPFTLTAAELRLLAYLPTHLTLQEIADRMSLSRHTIKTQAISIYAKLGVSSRREALEEAARIGLLDDSVLHSVEGAGAIA